MTAHETRSMVWLILTPEQSAALGFTVPYSRTRRVESHAARELWDRLKSAARQASSVSGKPAMLWAHRIGGPRWLVHTEEA